jgi:hypothetical protein
VTCPGVAPGAGGVAAGGEPTAPPDPAESDGWGNFSAAARARTAAAVAGEAGGGAGGAGGGEPAAPPGPVKSAASGNFSAAARARTAADTAGLERGTGDCAKLAGPPACEVFSAAIVGLEDPVSAEPARVPGAGVRAGGEPGVGALEGPAEPTRVPGGGVRAGGEPGVGALDPAWPPPWGGFGGGPGDIRQ